MGHFDDPRVSMADLLAFRADDAAERGDQEEARSLYAQAALLEEEMAFAVGPEAPRVKDLFLRDAAALWELAGNEEKRKALLALMLDRPAAEDATSWHERASTTIDAARSGPTASLTSINLGPATSPTNISSGPTEETP